MSSPTTSRTSTPHGYKADKTLFSEFLKTGAHEDNFVGHDRGVSFVLDNGTFRDFSQGPTAQTGNPLDVAIDGSGFLVVQTAAGERYTRDGNLQSTTRASSSPRPAIRARHLRPDRLPADRPRHQHHA